MKDSVNEEVYQSSKEEKEKITNDFEMRYVDRSLEDKIYASFEDENKLSSIKEEVYLALNQMKGFSGYRLTLTMKDCSILKGWTKSEKESAIRCDKRLAEDILLANRGKVSDMAFCYGYKSHYSNSSDSLVTQQYELVKWISETLKKQKIDITPLCVSNPAKTYAWLGSRAAPYAESSNNYIVEPFSDKWVDYNRHDIPKPYYEAGNKSR